MYQQITIVGNLGKDPEMRYTPSGLPVTTFSVAVSRRWTSQDGVQQEKTVWFRVTAWRKTAEVAAQYLHKGERVLVVGQVEEPQAFIDREGKPRASVEVTADVVRNLSMRGESAADGVPAHANASTAGGAAEVHEEDIPF